MKVILENELEKWAWDVMMSAHRKWEKNHGSVLRDQMNWYFEDIYKEEKEKMIKEEVERRLRECWGDDFWLGKEEYIVKGLANYEGWDEDDKKSIENDLWTEHEVMNEDISNDRKEIMNEVEDELREMYYAFFNAPENLTVYYDGEVVQG